MPEVDYLTPAINALLQGEPYRISSHKAKQVVRVAREELGLEAERVGRTRDGMCWVRRRVLTD